MTNTHYTSAVLELQEEAHLRGWTTRAIEMPVPDARALFAELKMPFKPDVTGFCGTVGESRIFVEAR